MIIKTVIDIRQPITMVFKTLVEPENMVKWMANFQKLESVKGRRPRKGSISKQIFKDSKGIMEMKEEVLNFEKNKKFELQLSHKNIETHQTFEFIAHDKEITRLILTNHIRLVPAFMGVFSIFMKGQMRRQQEADLMKFKKLLEK
jgi:uncharacterized protein YndB with AHSA1/START domain